MQQVERSGAGLKSSRRVSRIGIAVTASSVLSSSSDTVSTEVVVRSFTTWHQPLLLLLVETVELIDCPGMEGMDMERDKPGRCP